MALFRKKQTATPLRPSTRLIFLDADGVLNNANSDVTKLNVMEPDLLALLRRIVDEANARIVLSTTWRYTKQTQDEARRYFESAGIPLWISVTKNIGSVSSRRIEIIDWLVRNTDYFAPTKLPLDPQAYPSKANAFLTADQYTLPMQIHVTDWIAIDDLELTNEPGAELYPNIELTAHFVLTNRAIGLTAKNVKEALEKLGVKQKKKGFFSSVYSDGSCAQCCRPTELRDAEQGIYFCGTSCQRIFYDAADAQ